MTAIVSMAQTSQELTRLAIPTLQSSSSTLARIIGHHISNGHVTIAVLRINEPDAIAFRELLLDSGFVL